MKVPKPIMSSVVGASIIAVAILLSTLILSLGTRYIGFEGPSMRPLGLLIVSRARSTDATRWELTPGDVPGQ